MSKIKIFERYWSSSKGLSADLECIIFKSNASCSFWDKADYESIKQESQVTITPHFLSPFFALEGRPVTLKWTYSIQGDSFRRVEFRISGASVPIIEASLSGNPITFDDRVSVNITATYVTIMFRTMDTTDSNNYALVVLANGPTSGTADMEIIVQDPPSNIRASSDLNITAPANLTLNCSANGKPEPTITWTRLSDNTEVTMPLSITGRQDAGDYRCTADNGVGSSLTKDVSIIVLYPPSNIRASSDLNITAPANLTLNCSANGKPEPTITWTRLSDNTEVTMPLSITGRQDAGDYRCTADNGVGSSLTKDVSIIVLHPPSNIRASSDLNITAPANLTLNCSANGTPEPTITWTRLSDNTEVTMPLSITGRQDAGDYRCTADNGVGSSLTKDVSIIVLHPPSNIRASSDLNITAPANLTLNCSANGTPEPTITWTRLSDNTEVTMPLSITGRQDAGDYRCTADNGVGSSLTKDVSIIVLRDNTWIIVGGVLGAVALSVIIAVTVWCVRKKEYSNETKGTGGQKRAYQESASDNAPGNTHLVEMVNVGNQQPTPQNDLQEGQYTPLNPSTRSWEIPRHHVTIEKIIGQGAFGQVAKATADGLRGMPQKTLVAVKMTKAGAPESDKKDLLSELEVMKTLKPHPHVIKLIGCVTQSEPLLVLIEYVPFGDLLGYLRKSRGLHDTYYKDPDIKPQTSLTSQQLMKFAWQIADGMKYLSSRSIIHRDLAARNVLVGERETCKVTDFGMARDVRQENIYERKTKGRLPVKWTAYEALMFGTYTTKSDVWSFGVLLYEIFTIGGSPYPRMDGRKVANLLQEGYRMPKPQHVDNELYKIMISCWLEDSNARPTFLDLKNKLKNMENQHKRLINMDIYDNTQLYANVEDLAP
ncbi:fibroblast growth factor receptor 3-like isoform X1 [Montipora capricornis]|uniref:fibroblast growth factor receptor 3-like isoform X1 n=1 Tax=Montipora capricornis TaxID=246305 RepID=UPI0035F218F0